MKIFLLLIGLYALWKAFMLFIFPHFIDRFFANKTTLSTEEGYVAVPDQSHLIGTRGVASTDLRPCGKIQHETGRIDVVAESGYVSRGTTVEIVALRNGGLVVRPV